MNDPARLWADPRLIYTVAAAAVGLLLLTIWLFRRQRRQGRQAGVICLILSIALHVALILLVPLLPSQSGGNAIVDPADPHSGFDSISFSTFDPDLATADSSGNQPLAMTPLPVSSTESWLDTPSPALTELAPDADPPPVDTAPMPASLAAPTSSAVDDETPEVDTQLEDWLDEALADAAPIAADPIAASNRVSRDAGAPSGNSPGGTNEVAGDNSEAPAATVPGALESDFANRVGNAKAQALLRTGGDASTEAAVEAALKFLAESQRPDGAWDPQATGAGKERSPLGTSRGGAGARAETAITGLALLTLMGAGNTHQDGDYADPVYRGLAYLIHTQKPNGSLAGNASVYAANYSHGMAALAMCEAAAMTRDPSAVLSAQRAIRFSISMQHPTTGGWRYTEGDPGDLSQLGWQAMVLDGGHRAGIAIDPRAITGVERFLRSVRSGTHGGLASYRPLEAPSRTMTAEALATRLLVGQRVPATEIAEAERSLLQQVPGVGTDNYYYWYYATLALHQLQDDAWRQWNSALKERLTSTQRSNGSWSSDSLWGGYGGTVYTTSMAALCLEAYYRHALRSDDNRIANRPSP